MLSHGIFTRKGCLKTPTENRSYPRKKKTVSNAFEKSHRSRLQKYFSQHDGLRKK